jgi:hypothetical protein
LRDLQKAVHLFVRITENGFDFYRARYAFLLAGGWAMYVGFIREMTLIGSVAVSVTNQK